MIYQINLQDGNTLKVDALAVVYGKSKMIRFSPTAAPYDNYGYEAVTSFAINEDNVKSIEIIDKGGVTTEAAGKAEADRVNKTTIGGAVRKPREIVPEALGGLITS